MTFGETYSSIHIQEGMDPRSKVLPPSSMEPRSKVTKEEGPHMGDLPLLSKEVLQRYKVTQLFLLDLELSLGSPFLLGFEFHG